MTPGHAWTPLDTLGQSTHSPRLDWTIYSPGVWRRRVSDGWTDYWHVPEVPLCRARGRVRVGVQCVDGLCCSLPGALTCPHLRSALNTSPVPRTRPGAILWQQEGLTLGCVRRGALRLTCVGRSMLGCRTPALETCTGAARPIVWATQTTPANVTAWAECAATRWGSMVARSTLGASARSRRSLNA
jgi:hypothetical protein